MTDMNKWSSGNRVSVRVSNGLPPICHPVFQLTGEQRTVTVQIQTEAFSIDSVSTHWSHDSLNYSRLVKKCRDRWAEFDRSRDSYTLIRTDWKPSEYFERCVCLGWGGEGWIWIPWAERDLPVRHVTWLESPTLVGRASPRLPSGNLTPSLPMPNYI